MNTVQALHLEDTSGEETSKSVSKLLGNVKRTDSLAKLGSMGPRRVGGRGTRKGWDGREGESRGGDGTDHVRSSSRPTRGPKDADAPGVPSGKEVDWRARVEVEGKGGKGGRESNRSAKEAPLPTHTHVGRHPAPFPRPPSHPNKPED